MADTDCYTLKHTLHTFNSEKFPRKFTHLIILDTSLSTNIFHSEDNNKNMKMSKVSLRLSKTSIIEHQNEEQEEMEVGKNIFENKQGINTSKTQNYITGSILLPNEIIINVVVQDTNKNILLKKIFLQINEGDKARHLIRESIFQFNKLFEFERISVKFSSLDLSSYNLKPSRKNGLPNYDMPGINFLMFSY